MRGQSWLLWIAMMVPIVDLNFAVLTVAEEAKISVQYEASVLIQVDGILNEESWIRAKWQDRFTAPWDTSAPPDTRFGAVMNDDKLFFAFRVKDHDITTSDMPTDEMSVGNGDRVEIFLAPDLTLKKYYCLEIDPRGRVLDYQASFHRQFDISWKCPELVIGTKVERDAYVVEGSISHRALRGLDLPDLRKQPVYAGIFRAEFSNPVGEKAKRQWISWVHPNTVKPDFHIPAAFGRLESLRN